jgi:hypothetical protein
LSNPSGLIIPAAERDGNLVPAVAVGLLCLVPLTLTPVLPFIDFYAHVLRYYALSHVDGSAFASNYQPDWHLLPNLGFDVLGTAIIAVIPPLLAARLIAGLIIVTLYASILALARVLHGRVPLISIALAGILVYSHILVWGFANFLLGLGLAVGGVAFWIASRDRPRRQLAVSAAFGLVLLFVHAFAFAVWGLILGAVELMLAADAGELRLRPLAVRAGRLLLLAVVPALLFLQMPTATSDEGVTQIGANLAGYAEHGQLLARIMTEIGRRLDSFLRVAEAFSPPLDWALGVLLWGTLAVGLVVGALRLDRRLWVAAALVFLLIGIMPPSLFSVGHTDDRMPLVLLCLLAAGLSWQPGARLADAVRAIILGLFVVRFLLLAWGYHQAGVGYRDYLARLATLDTGRIGAPILFDRDAGRDRFALRCEPLGPLLALQNRTAAPTFDNPTQQPITLAGDLAAAEARLRAAPPAAPHAPVGPSPAAVVARYLAAGFDTVVTCTLAPPPPAPQGTVLLAQSPPWALYGRQPAVGGN